MSKKDSKESRKGPYQVQLEKDESLPRATARTALNPSFLSALTVADYSPVLVNADLNVLVTELEDQADSIKNGNFDRIEETLVAQAHTLDAIANHLFRRSIIQENSANTETYMKLGLKAQSQCRANFEALASMKNPRTLLTQTNIAHNQQINNRLGNVNPQSKLFLEKTDGKRLDLGTAATPIRGDQALETVGAKHGPKDT